jgi:multiple sugar transport system ATP-binding protein
MKFRAKVEVVESMGSELYAYFDVKGAAHTQDLDELAEDAGLSELPGQGGEVSHVVARLDPASRAAAGKESELVLNTSEIKLFDPNGGGNLTAREAAASAAAADAAG